MPSKSNQVVRYNTWNIRSLSRTPVRYAVLFMYGHCNVELVGKCKQIDALTECISAMLITQWVEQSRATGVVSS